MKRIVILFLVIINLSASAQIQDTIYNRIPHCWYPSWYDECTAEFCDTTTSFAKFFLTYLAFNAQTIYAKSFCTDEPIAVTGVALMVVQNVKALGGPWICCDSVRQPEFAMIYKNAGKTHMGADSLALLDSVRWDTLTPSVLKLPLMEDTARYGFAYCDVYQARFSSPVIVDSLFYLGGTEWTNKYNTIFEHSPVAYAYIAYRLVGNRICDNNEQHFIASPDEGHPWFPLEWRNFYGGVIPMVDFAMLNVEADGDSLVGTVTPSGSHSIHTDQTIRATPAPGYAFSHWNDGDTSNPRVIHLMQDTLFTAYFVTDTASHDTTGADTTGGTTAIRLPVTQAPAFALAPNPASGAVTVTVSENVLLPAELAVSDASGKEVLRRTMRDRTCRLDTLPAGIYFVTLGTKQGSSTQKLVVN